ncbi:MAG: hypothetical protein R2879_18475 [Saprospiraceae bacterium]
MKPKYLFLLVVLTFAFSTHNFGQSISHSPKEKALKLVLENNYQDGYEAFLNLIYKNIKYPEEARINCGIGVLRTKVTIGAEGKLKAIEFLNNFGFGVDQEVVRILKMTEENWKKSEKDFSFELSIAFQLSEYPNFESMIKVIAYGAGGDNGNSNCFEDQVLIDNLVYHFKKKHKEDVEYFYFELIRRGNQSKEFLDFKKENEAKNSEEYSN